jgi:hypothetical protein
MEKVSHCRYGTKMKKIDKISVLVILIIAAVILVTGCSSTDGPGAEADGTKATPEAADTASDVKKITVYQSATCGCCQIYKTYLGEHGFGVETTYTEEMDSVKRQYQIPEDMESCHTAIIEDYQYFIEGHVPVAAIEKLLKEKPDIDGIILPEMPAGAPGMAGVQAEPFIIYALSDGQASTFMTIE